jgi:hypothetical protein
MSTPDNFLDTPGGRSLAWLADAPLFIDADQVAAIYNAVARPEHATEKITLSLSKSTKFGFEGKGSLEAELGLATWIKKIFPFLDAKGTVGLEGSTSHERGQDKATEIELRPIDTPQRQLVQLALHYMVNIPNRTRLVSDVTQKDWVDGTFISDLPRALVFVEFPPQTAFIPMATEVVGGSVVVIYPELVASFVGPRDKAKVPTYPEPAYFEGRTDELLTKRQEYWSFFRDNFSSTAALEAIERKVSGAGGLIRWIDYRVPLGDGLPYLHMNVAPQGRYDTGTFAYRLVKRGYKHGLRVVGVMKSEPAMNVLAIFER